MLRRILEWLGIEPRRTAGSAPARDGDERDVADEQASEVATEAASQAGLSLYQFNSCPFCMRVRSAAAELGIELELRDTLSDVDHARAVIEATGRRTVPVLRIEDDDGGVEWLPESADIVRYLRDRFGN